MKVFDLRCEHDHRFEGWFASSEAFSDQLARGLLSCPICGVTDVHRLPSAPHLNLSAVQHSRSSSDHGGQTPAVAKPSAPPEAALVEQLQAQWLQRVREVIRNTENVGEAFAEEARRIHYNEAPERAIRGVASADQVAELADEGIDVVAIPVPDVVKEPLQ